MNINSVGTQNQVQLYQNNQADAPRTQRGNTNEVSSAGTQNSRLEISQKARELQTRRDSEATERVADNEQAEKSGQDTRQKAEDTQARVQAQPASRQPIDIVA